MEDAITKLQLTDASVTAKPISSEALGAGFRCGFLGVLHMEVFRQRIEDEANLEVLVAAPTITYKTDFDGEINYIESPEDYPDDSGKIRLTKLIIQCIPIWVLYKRFHYDDI